jgi:hypothetical protein
MPQTKEREDIKNRKTAIEKNQEDLTPEERLQLELDKRTGAVVDVIQGMYQNHLLDCSMNGKTPSREMAMLIRKEVRVFLSKEYYGLTVNSRGGAKVFIVKVTDKKHGAKSARKLDLV